MIVSLNPSKTLWGNPFGLSGVWSRNGGIGPNSVGLFHPLGAVSSEIAGDLTRPHREAGDNDIAKIELVHEGLQVPGEGVVVVPDGRLARLAEATTVVGDDAMTRFQQDGDLLFPRGPAQWVAVDEHHWLPHAVVFVVQIDWGRVLFTDSQVRHC